MLMLENCNKNIKQIYQIINKMQEKIQKTYANIKYMYGKSWFLKNWFSKNWLFSLLMNILRPGSIKIERGMNK